MAANVLQPKFWSDHISLSTAASQKTIQSEPAYSFNRYLLDLIDSGVPICPHDEIEVTGFIGAGATMSVSEGVWRKQLVAVKSFALFHGGSLECDATEQLDFAEKLRSASLELRVMSLDSIKECKNIVNLITGSWKKDVATSRLVPSLVVELANYPHRTLQDAFPQIRAEELGLKSHLIWGIINGLRELHFNSIVHGDLKPDNILLFQEESNPYPIPKLSDFGFCQADTVTERAASGTEYWLPPECLFSADLKKPFDTEELEKARQYWIKARNLPARDIHSFGLVAFSIIAGHPWFGADRGPAYTAENRAVLQHIKESGDMLKEAARSLLKDHLRLVNESSENINPSFGEMPTPASLQQWRDIISQTSHSGKLEHVKDRKLTEFLDPYLATCGGIAPRHNDLNEDLQKRKISWQINTTSNPTWRSSTGIYPLEILYLPETLSLLPQDRYQAVDWTEWLRPLSIEQESEKHVLNPRDAFQASHIFSTNFRGSKDLDRDYQHVVPQSMWPSAVSQLIEDANAPHSNPLEKYLVADCYMGGNGVEKNVEEGLRWLLKAVDSAKTEHQARASRLSFIHLFSHNQDPLVKPMIPTDKELEWTLEYLSRDGYGGPLLPAEEIIEYPSLLEDFTEKLRRDMKISLGGEMGFQLLRALFCFGNTFGREAVFPEPGYQTRPELINHLLGGKSHLPALRRALFSPGVAFEFFALFEEKLLRQMAASSSGQTFSMMGQFSISSMAEGGPKSFDMLLGRCYTEDVIYIGCDVAEHTPHELLPVLFSAMANENWSTFHWLVSSAAGKILIKSRWGSQSALFYAVMLRNPLFVTALLTYGADPNDGIKSPDGQLLMTPLAAACATATSIVPFVEEELEPSNCFFMESRGRFARLVGDKDHDNLLRQRWIVQALATAEGIDINLSCLGSTALKIAVRTGDEVMVKILLDNGASTAITSDIVILAMREPDNYLDILRMLAEHGADFNGRNNDGFTPLFTAVVVGLPNVVRVLLELGVNPSSPEPRASYTPLHMAAEKCDETIVRLLVGAGADRGAQTSDGLKPIDCLKTSSKLSDTSFLDTFSLFSLLLVDDIEDDNVALASAIVQHHLTF